VENTGGIVTPPINDASGYVGRRNLVDFGNVDCSEVLAVCAANGKWASWDSGKHSKVIGVDFLLLSDAAIGDFRLPFGGRYDFGVNIKPGRDGVANVCKNECEGHYASTGTADIRAVDSNLWGAYPRTLFVSHLGELTIERQVLQHPNNRSNDSQNSNPDGGNSCSSGKTILGIFVFAIGAALMKLAFYFGDAPWPQRNDRWLTWGTGAFAVALIGQGTILVLTGNWLP
jgi:hypothetical protein